MLIAKTAIKFMNTTRTITLKMIVVDVETTGLYEWRHSIVSIGAVEFENPQNQFYRECRIWDGAKISPEALKINGFTEEQVKSSSKSLEGLIVKEYLDWALNCNDITPAGENPSFDAKFLIAALTRHNDHERICDRLKWPFGCRSIDVHTLCYADHIRRGETPPVNNKRTNISLDTALVYVGMEPEPSPHNALNGAKLEAEVISRILCRKPLFPEYERFELPEYLK